MAEISRRTAVIALGGALSLTALSLSRSRGRPSGLSAGLVRTSFGSVAVLGSARTATAGNGPGGTHATGAAAAAAHTASGSVDVPLASTVHGAWTDAVVVDVEVHNRLRRPVALSPGQFRVRVDRGGSTVSLYSSDHDAAPLEPSATRTLRISYLTPPPDQPLSLEFEDPGGPIQLRLGPVGRPSVEEAWS